MTVDLLGGRRKILQSGLLLEASSGYKPYLLGGVPPKTPLSVRNSKSAMGNSSKPQRTKKIQIRLTPAELAAIEAKKEKSPFNTVAELMRHCVEVVEFEEKPQTQSNQQTTPSSNNPVILKLANQIRPIGVNLNQIARSINSLNKRGLAVNSEKVELALKRLENRLEKVSQMILEWDDRRQS